MTQAEVAIKANITINYYARIERGEDPEIAIQRAMRFYLKRGYSQNWVNQRLKSIEIRKELTDEWEQRGVKESSQFVGIYPFRTLHDIMDL